MQAAANNLNYTKRQINTLLATYLQKSFAFLVSRKGRLLLLSKTSLKVTTQDDTGTSTAKESIWAMNQSHSNSPATIQYSGEDVAKRLTDLANGERFLIF